MGIRRHRAGTAGGDTGARNPILIARLGLAAVLAAMATAAHAEAGDAGAEAKAEAEAPPCRHAYAFLGEPKLPPDFEHFDWVNPDAPKGGLMRMADTGSWDTFNRMSLGHSVRGMDTRGNSTRHIYDSLVIRNPTEPATVYGLIAECIAVAPDGAWIEFRLRDDAYWHDGAPLDAQDVAFSFGVYKYEAHPAISIAVSAFSRVEILDGNRVRYHVQPGRRHNRLLPIRIGELPVLSKRYWTQPGNDPGKPASTPPLGSGPYRIGGYKFGRWILWERDPDYWARDLPPNRGRYNFDRVKYDYFRDDQMRTEAVKGDVVDIHVENVPRRWATAYDFPPADAGVFRLQILPQAQPRVLWWPIFWNLRQARFRDIRVREALWLLNDFTWSNRRIGYGFYDVATSFFYESPLAARGLPNERELALLEPIRHLVPPRVFTEPYGPPPHQGSGWHRDNLLRAAELFREAGWVVEDKRLVHERTGEPFFLRFLMFSPALARSVIPYTHVVRRLGIESSVKSPELSNWLYRMRSGDFDAGVNWFRPDNTPTLIVTNMFSTASADQELSANWAHMRDPAIDRLIGALQSAATYPDYIAAARAIDRVLLWNFYYIPGMTKVKLGVAYWDRYGQPSPTPLDRTAFIDSWWWDPVKARTVAAFTGRE